MALPPRHRPVRRRRAQKFRWRDAVSARVTAAWPIQTCWLAQPSSCAARLRRLAEQGPLRAIRRAAGVREIGGHVPPLDAEVRMRAVIGGKRERPARCDRRRSHRRSRQARQSPARSALRAERQAAARRRKRAARDRRLALIGKNPDQSSRLHPRQPEHRQHCGAECRGIATAEQLDQLQRKDVERQPPAERFTR